MKNLNFIFNQLFTATVTTSETTVSTSSSTTTNSNTKNNILPLSSIRLTTTTESSSSMKDKLPLYSSPTANLKKKLSFRRLISGTKNSSSKYDSVYSPDISLINRHRSYHQSLNLSELTELYSLNIDDRKSTAGLHHNPPVPLSSRLTLERRAISCIHLIDSVDNPNQNNKNDDEKSKSVVNSVAGKAAKLLFSHNTNNNNNKNIKKDKYHNIDDRHRHQWTSPSSVVGSFPSNAQSALCLSSSYHRQQPPPPSTTHFRSCNICAGVVRSSVCLNYLNLSHQKIDIIREEEEEEEEEEDEEDNHTQQQYSDQSVEDFDEEDQENKMFDLHKSDNPSSGPLRPLRHRQSKFDRIEPFQKPDDLKSYWQEPKESLYTSPNTTPTIKEAEDVRSNFSMDNDQSTTAESTANGGRNSSASNFLRTNNLRSSCPPPARRRKSSDNGRMVKSPSQHANNYDTASDRNSLGLVDALQTKFNAVRKSWLSSFFHSFNSKEKQSKWKKSDDFQAEFFDRQSELATESLLNRRSPLQFDLNRPSDRKPHQMSLSAYEPQNFVKQNRLSTGVNNNKLSSNGNATGDGFNWTDSALHEPPPPSFIRAHSSGLKPRPRSACLDNTSYMLRMRNGNFIEYTLDSEGKDETCSIISSHQHLAAIGGSTGTSTSNTNNVPGSIAAINELNNNRHSEHYLSPPPQSKYQQPNRHSFLRNNNGAHVTTTEEDNINNYYKKQSSPLVPVRQSNSMMVSSTSTTSSSSSSSCFSKPTTTTTVTSTTAALMATATTSVGSSSLSSSMTNHHHQQNSFSTKTSTTTTSSSFNEMMSNHQNNNGGNRQMELFANVYWPVKNCTEIQIYPEQTAADVIKQMLTSQIYTPTRISNTIPNLSLPLSATVWAYSLRLACRSLNSNDCVWLHPSKNMQEFLDQNHTLLEKGWKLELRIRYVPLNIEELYRNDYPSFKFLYEQVLEQFLQLELSPTKLLSNQDLILELGCYEIFRTHPYLTSQGLEKNSNWETLENDFHRIFPICFTNSMKSKQLRKLIKSKYKKIYSMNQERVVFNFLSLVLQLINFNREVFHCSLGESTWCVPVDLMIGPSIGIAYFTSNSSPAKVIVKTFDLVEQINIVSYSTMNKNNMDNKNIENEDSSSIGTTKKILLNLKIKNEDDPLVISCSSFSMAQSIADLIDGYHRLATNSSESIWLNVISGKSSIENENNSGKNSLKSNSSAIIEPKRAEFDLMNKLPFDSDNTHIAKHREENQEDADYSNPVEVFLEINRDHLRIDEILGNGQFGDVHKGVYRKPSKDGITNEELAVAIKISRVQTESTVYGRNDIRITDQKLLCEAERMHKLDHHNIIKLIGVCSSSPVYVVMELAEYGELRSFLLKNGSQLEQRRLIEYSYQIASAMAYLEFRQFVHRDIAARNVLVFSFDCVKLADFGLSRYIEDTSYYMATNSKLPIKWMAPESINFRRFTTASDAWMFGVCVWEIFMLGKRPFQGVKNNDVIGLIECGDRLSKPSRCPEQLYELLLKCWRYEPDRRPTFRVIKRKIYDVYQNELGLIGAIARIDIVNDLSSSKSSLSSLSVGKEASSSSSSSLTRMHLSKRGSKANNQLSCRQSMADINNKNNLSQSESNLSLSASQSCVLDPAKIKKILDEQRKQMEEDQRWLQQNEFKWQSNSFVDSLPKSDKESNSEQNSSVYEDADCDKHVDHQSQTTHLNNQHLYSIPNLKAKSPRKDGGGDGGESYNSFKSTKSSFDNPNLTPSTSSSVDSNSNDQDCGLSVSLRKFFKHNQLTNAKVRQEMMEKVNCSSADVDRKEDPCYWSTISVVNSVRYLLKGVQELNTTEYIDLVKNVGLDLRNLLANVDLFIEKLSQEDSRHRNISVAQKKLSTDMNDLVESMKKTIMYSDTPMEGAYKQNMLEAAYVLVIDSKNLMDTVDEVRFQMKKNSE